MGFKLAKSVDRNRELFTYIRGRGEASNIIMFILMNEPLHWTSCKFFEVCIHFGPVKVVHFKG